jgi:hypothetical protein
MPKHLNKIFFLVLGLLIGNSLKAQSLDTDLQLLEKKEQAENTSIYHCREERISPYFFCNEWYFDLLSESYFSAIFGQLSLRTILFTL